MRNLVITWHRALWLACAFVVLSGTLASAAVSVSADFDGDGRRDQVTFDYGEPSVLRVWLSTTGRTSIIHSPVPVVCIVASDLDGDHRSELIARDASASLRVWTNRRKGFRAYHPRRLSTTTIVAPRHHSFDDGPTAPVSEWSWAGSLFLDDTLNTKARAPDAVAGPPALAPRLCQPGPRPHSRVSPRPPPFSAT